MFFVFCLFFPFFSLSCTGTSSVLWMALFDHINNWHSKWRNFQVKHKCIESTKKCFIVMWEKWHSLRYAIYERKEKTILYLCRKCNQCTGFYFLLFCSRFPESVFGIFFSLLCFSFALPNKCKFFLECTESNLSTVTNGPNRMWISDKERDCILERKQERSERKSFFFLYFDE